MDRNDIMCGIVGYIGPDEGREILINGLRRLEYRGYDSAGIAMVGPTASFRSFGAKASSADWRPSLESGMRYGRRGSYPVGNPWQALGAKHASSPLRPLCSRS